MGRIPDKDSYKNYVNPETATEKAEETPNDNNDNKEEK